MSIKESEDAVISPLSSHRVRTEIPTVSKSAAITCCQSRALCSLSTFVSVLTMRQDPLTVPPEAILHYTGFEWHTDVTSAP